SEQVINLPRVYWSDRIPAILLAVLIVIFGIQPNWLTRLTEPTTNAMMSAQNQVVNVSFK
ncbi:MAG: NAD(P)H-quinone oxidoreductase subunit D4, partial [Cyanobacteria bacterium J06636_27]